MKLSPIEFPVWDVPWQDEEPNDEPHLDQGRRVVAVSVHHGQPFAGGPGAIVTSYHPLLTFADTEFMDTEGRRDGHRLEVVAGPLALGRAMAWQLTETLTVPLKSPSRFSTQDVRIHCGNTLVPALELGIGIPEATVIVSADLLTHPIALGLWRWHDKLPMLHEVSFE